MLFNKKNDLPLDSQVSPAAKRSGFRWLQRFASLAGNRFRAEAYGFCFSARTNSAASLPAQISSHSLNDYSDRIDLKPFSIRNFKPRMYLVL